ncbi:probable carotenoid cleavage dioxygenase 4, chloroplastic [Impatiens glandulifera]|uniref:probable carotenoid cleavage dioxygenase 4, chloroplastic n=1 Tax=Impatiens glandulifera TaxID=253017 RepID=UPI001FB10EB7|nr:probable carotenoid cleavage dioxygenase 4, chloroplastic [Impatiens glandulifera]
MDSFSSTFLSPFSLSTPSPSPHLPHSTLFTITSVRIEETQSPVTTKPNPQSPPQVNQNPPSKTRLDSKPSRRIQSSVPGTILNAFDDIINKFIDPPIRPSVDPKFVLADNFSPVLELPPSECEIIFGSIPECLNGAYIRNGPNPQFLPRGPYHLFDGDGMLHAIRISKGRATLCSRYVRTYKYSIENEIGGSIVPNVFSGFNGLVPSAARGALIVGRTLAGQFNPINGVGVANTSLAMFGGGLFAMGESDLPYAVKISPDGDVLTVGRYDFGGKLFMSMTAHPKVDPETKEAFGFRYGPIPPFLTFFRFDRDGNKQPDVPIFSLASPSLLHDFAITKKYAVFSDMQIGMNPGEMIFGSGSPVGADTGKVSRVGIIPRYAMDESEMKWFDVPGFNPMHSINAWEEDDGQSVILVAPNILSVEHTLERMDLIHSHVEKIKIDLKSGIVSRQPIATRNLDFGVINPNYIAKKSRYVYAAIGDPMPKISGVVKLDLSLSETDKKDCTVASRMFGPGCYGGEPFFVAKEPNNPIADEDDGYVITYVHNENTGESRFLVMDARSSGLDVVAVVRLPQRVPYGFHGLFVNENDLKKL